MEINLTFKIYLPLPIDDGKEALCDGWQNSVCGLSFHHFLHVVVAIQL